MLYKCTDQGRKALVVSDSLPLSFLAALELSSLLREV